MKARPALPRLILMERVYPSNTQTTFSLLSKSTGLALNEVPGSLEVYNGGASAFVPSGGFNPDLRVFITTGNKTYSFLQLETQTQKVCHVMHHDGRVELLAEFLAQHEHNKVIAWQMQLQKAAEARALELAKAQLHFFPTPMVNPILVQIATSVKDPIAVSADEEEAAPAPAPTLATTPTPEKSAEPASAAITPTSTTEAGLTPANQTPALPTPVEEAAPAPNTTTTPASKPREDSDSKSTQSRSKQHAATSKQVQAAPKPTPAPAPKPVQIAAASPASKPREDSNSKSTQSGSKQHAARSKQVQAAPALKPAQDAAKATPASKPREDLGSESKKPGTKQQRAKEPQVQAVAAPAPKSVQIAAAAPASVVKNTIDESTEPATASTSITQISSNSENGAAKHQTKKKAAAAILDYPSLKKEIETYMQSPSTKENELIKKANTLVTKYKTTLPDISPRKVYALMLEKVNDITDIMTLLDIQSKLEKLLYGLESMKELINDQAFETIYNKSKRFLSQSDQEALAIYALEKRAVSTLEFFQRCGLQEDRMAELIDCLIKTNNLIALRNGFDLLNFAEIVDMTDTLSTLLNKGGYPIDIINQFIPDHSQVIPDDICQKLFKIANIETVKRYCTNQERYTSAMILICSNHRADLLATVIDQVRDLAYVRSVGLVTAMHAAIIDGNNDDDRMHFLNQLIDEYRYPLFFKDPEERERSIITDVIYLTNEKVSTKLFRYLIEKTAELVTEGGKLLDQKFYCEYQDHSGFFTALTLATMRNNYDFIKILAEVGKVAIEADVINNLLNSAASQGHEQAVRGLHELGADPAIAYQDFGNALDQALYTSSIAITQPVNTFGVIKYLVEKSHTIITRTVNLNDVSAKLKLHVKNVADLENIINQIKIANSPELWDPTFKPRCERIRDLAKGANAIALQNYILESHYEATLLPTLWIEALTEACYSRNEAVIDPALERLYGNANVIDTRGRTPLMCLLVENEGLITGQSFRIAKKLIEENHAQLFYTLNDRNYSVLFEAMLLPARLELKNRGILQEVCDFVIEKMNQQNLLNRSFYYTNSRTDCTLLEFVSMRGLSEYIEILVSKFSFDLSDETYHSAILYAAIYGNDEVLKMFKTKGVNLNGKFNNRYLVDSALYAVLGHKNYPEELSRLVTNLALLVAEEDFVVSMPPLKVGEALTILDGKISEDIARNLLLKSSNNQINNESSRQWQQKVSQPRESDGVSESKGRS